MAKGLRAMALLVLMSASVQSGCVAIQKRMLIEATKDVWENGNLSRIDELYSQELREGAKDLVRRLRHRYPDLRLTIHDVVIDDRIVVGRFSFHGTHREYGRPVLIKGIVFGRASGMQVVEEHVVYDRLAEQEALGFTTLPPGMEESLNTELAIARRRLAGRKGEVVVSNAREGAVAASPSWTAAELVTDWTLRRVSASPDTDVAFLRSTQADVMHTHSDRSITIVVRSGVGRIFIGAEARDIGPGDVVSIPRSTPHRLDASIGPGGVEALVLISPGMSDGEIFLHELSSPQTPAADPLP